MNLGSFVEPIPRNFLFLLGGESEIIICLDVRIDSGANCPALLIDNGVMSIPLGQMERRTNLGLTRGVLPRRPLFPARSLSPGETDDQTRCCSFGFSFVSPVRFHRATLLPELARGKEL
mgnify:CR=1 FL=1